MVSKLKGLRIGYVPRASDFSHPGDRRRFSYYARKRNISFELADPSQEYDLVVLSDTADITVWSRYAKGKIIYQLVNSYLAVQRCHSIAMLRGPAKFVFRQQRYLELSYTRSIQKMCKRSDAVICTTKEQRADILPFSQNVHIILDFQAMEVSRVKQDYSVGETFHIVWEGLPGQIIAFRDIRDMLAELSRKHSITLHFVTDIQYKRFNGPIPASSTKKLIRQILGDQRFFLYEWNTKVFSSICTACDLAVIPILSDNPLFWGKPENKLVLFWRMGMPVVTSATPAYSRAMAACGLPMTCQSTEDWVLALERYMTDAQARKEAGQCGRAFAESHYGEEKLLEQWDELIASVL